MVKCTACSEEIYFKKNSRGKYVPFTRATNICHYETCVLKPKDAKPVIKADLFWKPKGITYETIKANTKLDRFVKHV